MSNHCGSMQKCNNAEGCQGCEYEGELDDCPRVTNIGEKGSISNIGQTGYINGGS
jgi:hypothetical protein